MALRQPSGMYVNIRSFHEGFLLLSRHLSGLYLSLA